MPQSDVHRIMEQIVRDHGAEYVATNLGVSLETLSNGMLAYDYDKASVSSRQDLWKCFTLWRDGDRTKFVKPVRQGRITGRLSLEERHKFQDYIGDRSAAFIADQLGLTEMTLYRAAVGAAVIPQSLAAIRKVLG